MLRERSVALMRQLIDCIIEGLSRYGCGMMGIAYPEDEPTLGPVRRNG
jgi:hypothetical protein